ncbi:nitrilase-related carbon-nitrogen hydrolase [Burkholderia sp. WSM2232]|uniref:nitrilase-related carbon-nitrogen hydrolase n=1 Tax=Burkholderia sp. WSM2232 TaxID=944436 RepID=UPI000413A90D|nr:nitrilase-related carbon-nitrogen hydrolase [Burkholderia sp. WSM2232]
MPSSTASSFCVASVPLVSCRSEAAHNVARVADWLALAASQNIDLVVFPEACISGYASMAKLGRAELNALAQTLDGPSMRAVADAVERTGVGAGVGFVERATDGQFFNSYVVCLPGGVLHCHRKLHAIEHPRIVSGDRFTVFDASADVRIGILIGADNYVVENVRMTALMGATLLLAPHRSYGFGDERSKYAHPVSRQPALARESGAKAAQRAERENSDEWLRRWLPARAVDNGMFVVFSDGAEIARENRPAGTAMIVDPFGRILASSPEGEAPGALVHAGLDATLVRVSPGREWLAARRPDLYKALSRIGSNHVEFDARAVSAKGAVALSFAQVRRNGVTG